mmetsp:Transcript_55266/g.131772  ORF Transcript_55266/g.131772 Transcript_55266/m.131772 type:complete len:556 (+) Transcript_55266:45-1712(+)
MYPGGPSGRWSDVPPGDGPIPTHTDLYGRTLGPPDAPRRPVSKLDVQGIEHTFEAWAAKAQAQIDEGWSQLKRERVLFEEEKERMRRDLHLEIKGEYERMNNARRRAEAEHESQLAQIRAERDSHKAWLDKSKNSGMDEHKMERWKFALEREKFRRAVEANQKERERVFENNTDTEAAVEINIGGTIFEAPRHTLMRQPGSLLERLMAGRAQAPRDRHGRVFLDRDPKIFTLLLDFLRTPAVPPLACDGVTSQAIGREAEFYGLRFFPFPLAYAFGGHNGQMHLNSMEVLDVEKRGWRSCPQMSTPRSYLGAEVLHGRIYAFGGGSNEYKAMCVTECFDCLRSTWVEGPDLLIPRRNCASAVLDNRVFAIGGYDGNEIVASVESYDPRMKSWMPLESLTTPRSSATAAIVDDSIWVMGGTKGERLRTVERYDLRMNRWQPIRAEMQEVRSTAKAAPCGKRLYVLGGTDERQRVHRSVECCSPELRAPWSFVQPMPEPRMDFGCCTVGESVMVAGGQDGGQVLPSTEFFRPDLDEWQAGPSMLSPRHGHALLLVNL